MQHGEMKMKKLLLMGRQGAGKTSMHSIIFANYPAKETMGIGFTVDVAEAKFRFMGNLTLNLWDCGGQDTLMKFYFNEQKEIIFKNVEVLIYVFDVNKADFDHDMNDYRTSIMNLNTYSKDAHIFVLIHKMDKIKQSERNQIFESRKQQIMDATKEMEIKEVFGTSIWDETLYKAWSQIVQLLIPNMINIKKNLSHFSDICNSDEIVLFERSTFLNIAYHENRANPDVLKYERLSNIIKQFKLSCNKLGGATIRNVEVRNSNFSAFIEEFTENTIIMVVFSDPKIKPAAIELNIECARKSFEQNNRNEMDNLSFDWNPNRQ